MRPRVYQPSGRVPALTVPVLLCSLGCAGLGAFLYAWATLYGGLFLAIGLMCAFPVWLVLLVKWACHLGKIRNPGVMRQFGLLVGLVGWAAQWICWIVFASYGCVHSMPGNLPAIPIADLLTDPEAFRQGLSVALAETEWSEHDRHALLKYLAWLVELCLMLILPSRAGFVHAGRPFCECRDQWCTVSTLPYLFAGETLLKARAYLAAHPAELLAALTPMRGARNCYGNVTVYSGRYEVFISVVVNTLKFDVRRVTREEQVIVKYLRVSERDLSALKERLSRPRQRKSKPAGRKVKRAKPNHQSRTRIVDQV